MPPKQKITKQMIIDAAVRIVRECGHEHINARTISEKLSCSTQPVMYYFKTIDEIRTAAYKAADEFHSGYIMPTGKRETMPLLELGLNYIRFAYEEKNLFRFLFQSNSLSGFDVEKILGDPGLSEIIMLVSKEMNCDRKKSKEAFFSLFVSAHGIASLLANNAMEYEEDIFRAVLENVFNNIQGE